MRNKFHIALITIILLNLAFVAVAVASGGGSSEQSFTWKDWLWPVINFAILVFILVFFGRKPAKEYFKKRTELIEQSLKEAKEAKELARKTLDEVRARLSNTDQELEQILEAAKKSGEREKSEIISEGERLKEKIIEQAKANIDFELLSSAIIEPVILYPNLSINSVLIFSNSCSACPFVSSPFSK